MNLFTLVAKLGLDSEEYEKGLDDANSKAGSFTDGLKKIAGAGADIFKATTAAVLGVSTEFVNSVGRLAQQGDNIDKISQKMGLSAQAYQEWDAIMQHSGTSINSMQMSMKTLATAAETGNDAFKKLGMSQQEIANMNQEELFAATITALQNVESETERTYLAGQLLGRGATELGALLNTSAEDTEAMRQRVHELGGVLSDEAVKSAAAYQDSLQDMQTAINGIKNNALSNFLPAMTTIMDGLTEIFAGNSGSGVDIVMQGIQMIGDGIEETMPQIIDTMVQVVSGLLETLVNALPKFLDMGMELIGKMINGISSNMPAIISKIVEVATKLITSLIQRLPEFLQMGVKFIVQMISGLVQATPQILSALGEIAMQMLHAITEVDWLGLGKQVVDGIASGIKNFGGAIWNSLKGAVSGGWEKLKGFLGISSPSRLMRDTIGKMIPLGIAEGINSEMNSVMNSMGELANITVDPFRNIDLSVPTNDTQMRMEQVTVNVYASEGQDERTIADNVIERLNEAVRRGSLVNA